LHIPFIFEAQVRLRNGNPLAVHRSFKNCGVREKGESNCWSLKLEATFDIEVELVLPLSIPEMMDVGTSAAPYKSGLSK
jgi:hypothetical protein